MYNLFEDEEDIFQGSPKSKFLDIVFNANSDLVHNELARIMERMAVMELMLQEQYGEDEIDEVVRKFEFERSADVDMMVKNLYIISVGNVLSRNE
ncbi:MAG: DUF2018 family protein [Sulfuricurvum sp.]|jgi:hypothetical protein|uniref:DUF2018 family protein n=1 Tax=Sulfuricurvum sp. TaxID=2025608 RepID=UPI0025F95ACD|nr:DUF2018 family protein [Sulfuricurvum sp.]MCK9372392.1 DUF2018 family protein [Sulfuricurvum sp.]